jgi:transposase-like protein
MTVRQFEALFPSDDACKAYLLNHRWPYGIRCPRCGHDRVYELAARPWHWQCHKCAPHGYRFSILVGTVFENTNYNLRDWFRVIHMMLTSKKGVSALQVHRVIGTGSYRTSWYMCHRIRAGLRDEHFCKLMGIVEVDETYIGGKTKNKHWSDRDPDGGHGKVGKIPVVGAVRRKGNVVARVIEAADGPTLTRFVLETVSHRVSLLATDDNHAYRRLNRRYPHGVVKHSLGEYVHGNIHTNTIEGFWSLFKRGIVGTFHKVSRKYLPLYVSEFQFLYNHRENPDIFGVAIASC